MAEALVGKQVLDCLLDLVTIFRFNLVEIADKFQEFSH